MGMRSGTVFADRYRILRPLGNGAMGAVYEVLDTKLDCRRALKVMLPHILERPELRERFAREAKVVGPVDSEHIVDVFDAGVDEATRTPYLVMKLLTGEDLRQRLTRKGRLMPDEALRYLRQIALALGKTHSLGIVHRDLKPSNLFVEEREHDAPRIRILDFGVAKALSQDAGAGADTAPRESARGDATRPAGTPHYMAPEQFRRGTITAAVDIYALGMIAFSLLVGRAYWAHDRDLDDTVFETLAQGGPREPASVRAERHGVEVPPGFDAWFGRATAVEPSERFPSAASAINALAEALGVVDLEPLAEPPSPPVSEPPPPSRDGESTAPGAETVPDESQQVEPRGGTKTATLSTLEPSRTRDLPDTAFDRKPSSTQSPPPRRPAGRASWLGLGVTALLAVGGILGWRAIAPAPAPPARPVPAPSPLKAPKAVLACPIMEASGVEEPAGWLGAAAAATMCERARIVLGGDPARTLVPAELLDLPRPPTDDFPADVYAAQGARARSLEAARRRADAYVDGKVEREPSGRFRVSLSFHRSDAAELARTEKTGRALYEAVREAMTPLVADGLLPRADHLDPTVADFSRTGDVDRALLLVDTWLAVVQNAGTLPEECKEIEAKKGDLGDMGPVKSHVCAFTLGLAPPAVDWSKLPEEPSSRGGIAARALLEHFVQSNDRRKDQLVELYDREQTPWGRSILAATASCLLQSSDPETASRMALRAVQAEPTNQTGDFCRPWGQAGVMTTGTFSWASIVRTRQAWQPMEARAWVSEPGLPIEYARRAYVLSPYATDMASSLADLLLRSDKPEEVRKIALDLADQKKPVHVLESEHLLLRLEASELRFGAALQMARGQMVILPEDAGWVRVQRVQVAWRALGIGLLLGRASEVADLFVERFVDPEPAPIDFGDSEVTLRLPAICAYASRAPATRCFSRLRALAVDMLRDTVAFTQGAERFAMGDHAGAARAWRPLVKEPEPYVQVLGDAMITAFESAGETGLVEKLERVAAKSAETYGGASLDMVRAARRAAKRGKREEARALATRIIEAWSEAADPVPAVAEMKRLLAQIR
jgi:eukaryotic-like serine/threonine-protein kinase